MGFDIKKNSLLSAIPYFILYITCLVFGFLADYLIEKKIFSVERSRKTFNSLGHYIPMLALIGLGFLSKDNPTAGVALLAVAVGVNGGIYSGYMINHIDLSPIHSGVLMGISNFFASLNSVMGPLIAGWIVTDSTDASLWRIIFFLTAGYYFIGNTAFVIFGKAEVQPWNYEKLKPNIEELETGEATKGREKEFQ